MRLNTKGRYAVMAVVDLAKMGDGEPICLAEIAERQEISLSYLEQLFAKLRKSGIVKSVRGPGGGYVIAYPASTMRISDVIMAVDEPVSATRCKNTSSVGCMNNKSRCSTHDLWSELTNHINLYLNSITISDVCENKILGSSGVFHKNHMEQAHI